ncbi:MAG: hypothetical protein JW864_01235 [Spirochaetes bacterium]|nr:hypothetical protein [Spirochaetota bacterium]
MNKIAIVLVLIYMIFSGFKNTSLLYPQDISGPVPTIPEDISDDEDNSANAYKSKNINLDVQALYGPQFNQMISSLNLSQESESFVYLISSNFSRSGDFSYEDEEYVNSGFYENNFGLTANWNWNDLKLIIEGEADNDSRGMFNNQVYSKEEKGKNKISAKTIYKFSPSTEWSILLGGAWYKHSLVAVDPEDHLKSRLVQGNVKLGWEFVWSASNRLRINADYLYYDYKPDEIENDSNLKAEFFNDFSITRNLGFTVGAGYVKNEDDENLDIPVPVTATISLKGLKNFTSVFSYRYDIVPFQPEEFYLEQKYISPDYTLPPGKVHIGEARLSLKVNSLFNITGEAQVEKNEYYYNYYPDTGNVLSANAIEAIVYSSKLETNISIYKKILELSLGGEYFYFDADENITYRPDFRILNSFRYNGKKWKFEWANQIRGKVYFDPYDDRRIPEAVIGSFGIQRIVLEGSYFYAKIENLYNNRYTLRKDYPEPGVSLLGGLRILI